MPAGNVYAAPVGTKPGADGWKLIGHTTDGVTLTDSFTLDADRAQLWFDKGYEGCEWPRSAELPSMQDTVNRAALNLQRAADRYSIGRPVKWSATIDALPTYSQELLDLYYRNFRQRCAVGIDPATWDASIINERSKPVGLTKDHEYTDSEGDAIKVEPADLLDAKDAVAFLKIEQVDDDKGFYVLPAFSVPLALNVLGYDRPSIEWNAAGATEYGGHNANYPIPGTQSKRDQNVAAAIDYLRGADIFDQREAAKKADAEAAAKRDAEYAKHKQESFDRAKQAYADAIRDQIASGIDAESAAKVQTALSAYETARRKLEGLPS